MSIHLAQRLRAYFWLLTNVSITLGFLGSACQAHVGLNSPNGGETLTTGSEFPIEWFVEISHNTLGWDLWYSAESNNGPWEEIALGLAPGDTSTDAVHTFDWVLPNVNIPAAWVRVRQDNAGDDYFGISETSFSINALLAGADFTGDGKVDGADLTAWQTGFGASSGAVSADGDADLDADVDGADFLAWQSEFDGAGVAVVSQSVPEPMSLVLLVLGTVCLLSLQR